MECHPSYAVLLDEDGKFLYAANLRYEVGQTVTEPMLMQEETEATIEAVSEQKAVKSLPLYRIQRVLVSMAACLVLLVLGGYYFNYVKPYSTITLSINPAVEMQLSRKGKVVGLKGLNADGVTLLEGFEITEKDKQSVTDALVRRAADMGYLKEGGKVSLKIDTPKPELYSQYDSEIRACYDKDLLEDLKFDFDFEVEADDDDDDDDWDDDDKNDDDDDDDDNDKKYPNQKPNVKPEDGKHPQRPSKHEEKKDEKDSEDEEDDEKEEDEKEEEDEENEDESSAKKSKLSDDDENEKNRFKNLFK